MKKLSKEQAQWLIKRFDDAFGINDSELIGIHAKQVRDGAKQIINQCTEKEFPEQWIHYDNGDTKFCFTHDESDHPEDPPYVIMDADYCGNDEQFKFTYDEFKQFYIACNNIMCWIQEQKAHED